ncbi:hypothetical protein SLE2022_040520 [Rubroshorea leprosula]
MEDESVARATELRLKISNCIEKATTSNAPSRQRGEGNGEERKKDGFFDGEKNPIPDSSASPVEVDEVEDGDGETPRLLNIRDALESLESLLVVLQNLQQQQQYEREVALTEIDYSRKILLEKLKDYKGEDLEVIHEASAFAGETVENTNSLLLPPYPSRPPTVLGFGRYQRNQKQTESNNSSKGLGCILITVAKTVLPLVGVICVLSSSNLAKRITSLKFLSFQHLTTEEKKATTRCPPGKVLVMEGGEARGLVRESVVVPFELIIAKPDVNYGCG